MQPKEQTETLIPPVGTVVKCYFGSHVYRGKVVKHGRVAPHVLFTLKNGRVIQGRATILPHDASTGVVYRGYLAQLYPEQSPLRDSP